MDRWWPLLLLAAGALLLGGGSGNNDPVAPEKDEPMVDKHTRLKAIAAGEATDPKVVPLLAELQATLSNAGVHIMTARDLTTMSKAPLTDGPDEDHDKTRPVAIPDRQLWPGLVEIALIVQSVVQSELADVPLRFAGYREGYGRDGTGAGSYNEAVGGADNSAHIRADAIDVWLGSKLLTHGSAKEIVDARHRLFIAFAKYKVQHHDKPLGFGVYTNDIHFDVDHKDRANWEHAADWIAKAEKELAIA